MMNVDMMGRPITVDIHMDAAPGAPDASDALASPPSLLPDPLPGQDGIADQVARMVLVAAHSQRAAAKKSECSAEKAVRAAEDLEVAKMHDKASSMRTQAWAEGGVMVAGAGLSFAGGLAGSKTVTTAGEQVFQGSKVVAGFAGAGQEDMDAAGAEARATARRALRSSEASKKDVDAADELAGKALAFVQDASRTDAETKMIGARRA